MYRTALGLFVIWIALAGAAQAAVSFSAPAAVGSIDTAAPRLEVLTPNEVLLVLRSESIYFSWQTFDGHPGSAAQTQLAEVIIDDATEASFPLTPGAEFGDWNWSPADGPIAYGHLRVISTDAFGNQTEAWSSAFTLLPAGSPAQDAAPRVTRLAGAQPNPFNPRTTLHFELAAAEDVRLEIFDLRGRRVRTLLDRALEAGPHAIDWDGLGDDARRLPGGTYLVRFEAGRGADRTLQTQKAVLLP